MLLVILCEFESCCLTGNQEHILKEELTPKVFYVTLILVSHQKQRKYSEGRTYTVERTYIEVILYMSLNLRISPGIKNIF